MIFASISKCLYLVFCRSDVLSMPMPTIPALDADHHCRPCHRMPSEALRAILSRFADRCLHFTDLDRRNSHRKPQEATATVSAACRPYRHWHKHLQVKWRHDTHESPPLPSGSCHARSPPPFTGTLRDSPPPFWNASRHSPPPFSGSPRNSPPPFSDTSRHSPPP